MATMGVFQALKAPPPDRKITYNATVDTNMPNKVGTAAVKKLSQ